MQIPDLQSVLLPLLQFMGDGKPHATGDAEAYLTEFFQLKPSTGSKPQRLRSRVTGAHTHFKQASLIEPVSRGVYRITTRGLELLASGPTAIDLTLLRTLPPQSNGPAESTPREKLRHAVAAHSEALFAEMLDQIRGCSPACFERIVVDLLRAMGYGGPRAHDGSQFSHGTDGALEGIVKAHKLGHEAIYVSAHRSQSIVAIAIVQAFALVLENLPARTGMLITTSNFDPPAAELLPLPEKKIVLINGDELARLMVHHNIGVAEEQRYVVKHVDASYFEREV